MNEPAKGIPIFDPTVYSDTDILKPAERKGTLRGRRMGLLWNGKAAGDKLMKFVLDELELNESGFSDIVVLQKEFENRPASAKTYNEMTGMVDLVITGVGD